MTAAARITIAISTMGARIGQLRLPAPCADLTYLILVQAPAAQDITDLSARTDVSIVPLPTLGLSNSRNAALDLCETPFLLFADDDMELLPDGIRALADQMEHHPALALVAGWRDSAFQSYRQRSASAHALSLWNAGRICAPEFMVRLETIRHSGIRFDPRFGVGSPLPTGEDYIFVTDLLKQRLSGRSVPIITGHHIGASTGQLWQDTALLNARRQVLSRVFGWRAPFLSCAYALRHFKRFETPETALRFCVNRLMPQR